MRTPSKSPLSLGVPLRSGALAVSGIPFGLALFVFLALVREQHHAGLGVALRALWTDGGVNMYLVLGLSVMGAIVAALAIVIATRGSASISFVAVVFAALPAPAGAVLASRIIGPTLLSLTSAPQQHRSGILFGVLSESTTSTLFGATMSAGLLLGAALALGGAATARDSDSSSADRRAFAAGALVAAALGVCAIIGARAVHDAMALYGTLATTPPIDMFELARGELERLETSQKAFSAILAGTALLIAMSAAATRASPPRRMAFAGAAFLALALVAVGLLPRLSRMSREHARLFVSSTPLFAFDAPVLGGHCANVLRVDSREQALQAAVKAPSLYVHGVFMKSVCLGLSPDVSSEVLERALELLLERGARRVTLLVQPTVGSVNDLPPPFDLIGPPPRGVDFELGYESERCTSACEMARVEEGLLIVGNERWPLEEALETSPRGATAGLPFALTPSEPRDLLRAGVTAMKHGRSLLLLSMKKPPAK